MSDGSSRPPLVIVGAGPAGAALALLFASRGIGVTLIERQRDFEREFRGEVMMPSGLAVLDALGVDVEKAGIPHRRPNELEIYVERKRVAHLDASGGDLRRAARHSSYRSPHCSSTWWRSRAATRTSASCAAPRCATCCTRTVASRACASKRPQGEQRLHAALVVGADGRASIVRRRGGFTAKERGTPMDVVWTKLPASRAGARWRAATWAAATC